MKGLLILLAVTLAIVAQAQKIIPLEQVGKHIGESVTIKSKITGVRYVPSAVIAPTFINLGGYYSRQTPTVVVWGDVRKKLGYAPEQKPYSEGWQKLAAEWKCFGENRRLLFQAPLS